MKILTVNIPDNVDMESQDILILLSAQLYEKGKLSLGQAADMAGFSKRTFAELLSKYNVSIFNYPAQDLLKDIKNA